MDSQPPLDLCCLSSIEVNDPQLNGSRVAIPVILHKDETGEKTFIIRLKYPISISEKCLPLLRLAALMPLLNYGLFCKHFILRFPLSEQDIRLVETLHRVFSRDIYVNKILRRRADYILPAYLPDPTHNNISDAAPKAAIIFDSLEGDTKIETRFNNKTCGILSSGGKESLLSYGLLKELNCDVYPLYVNESGGHWRTALPAYRYHKKHESHTQRVWTNIDRFYVFMLDNLPFIRPDHRLIQADTYPLRLCIFPFYVFLLLPFFVQYHIGNLLIGSEFDDFRTQPVFQKIPHYYGIYDQHQNYDLLMNQWYQKRVPGVTQWSAVRTISGLIVERILVNRYPQLARLQRSCHSCHIVGEQVFPCGVCSKCQGVLLFLLANQQDPTIMKFTRGHISKFLTQPDLDRLRLDKDEKNHSLYLGRNQFKKTNMGEKSPHVEKIHLNKLCCDTQFIPQHLRKPLLHILEQYTHGYCMLQKNEWISANKVYLS